MSSSVGLSAGSESFLLLIFLVRSGSASHQKSVFDENFYIMGWIDTKWMFTCIGLAVELNCKKLSGIWYLYRYSNV